MIFSIFLTQISKFLNFPISVVKTNYHIICTHTKHRTRAKSRNIRKSHYHHNIKIEIFKNFQTSYSVLVVRKIQTLLKSNYIVSKLFYKHSYVSVKTFQTSSQRIAQ